MDWNFSTAGSAEIAVMADCVRCTIASAQKPGLAKDMRITRTLVRDMNQRVSVYCNVAQGAWLVRFPVPGTQLRRIAADQPLASASKMRYDKIILERR